MIAKVKPLTKHQIADLAILVALASLVVWYILDALSSSTQVLNLILILPFTVLTLLLCLIQFIYQLIRPSVEALSVEAVKSVLPVIALFAVYTLTLPWLGFDVGTCLFVGAFLWFHGERRWPWIVGYSLSFASIVSLFFAAMLPYPMPMLVFPS
ncbi:MAG: tripartite tricarboxylate transporter TctB family protein [Opitutales bacterium]|jgi:putative tricarboxylic transport membrane protein|nr:tripartite tricarboxylate transporter TctB family protein [Opitutales bacterium]MBT5814183.1 tripartite tricarboxylate transporter TctB family protein [Opitutales bacterium]